MGCPICDNKPANCDCTAKEREQFDEIHELQAEIARLREERRWVPVGERLPELDSSVLVAWGYPEDEEQTVSQAWHYHLGLFTNLEDMEFHGVSHWQPLPPGPEANG